jgi:uncharacterized membrane protein
MVHDQRREVVMPPPSAVSSGPRTDPGVPPQGAEQGKINQNIEAVLEFYTREDQKISWSQRLLERLSQAIVKPAYLGFILAFVLLWVSANGALNSLGRGVFDPPPFFWLQGLIGLGALLTMIVILAKQNRLSRLAEQRAHLDLTVTLLTEQKTAKLIDLVEELRRDLPSVRDRHDPEAAALQRSMSPNLVLAVLEKEIVPDKRQGPLGGASEPVPIDHLHSN